MIFCNISSSGFVGNRPYDEIVSVASGSVSKILGHKFNKTFNPLSGLEE